MEKRSTGTPDSATRIAAINPASPPPTMIIFGFFMRAISLSVSPQRKPGVVQSESDGDAGDCQRDANDRTKIARCCLRTWRHGNAPLAREIPEAVAEMECRRGDADDVETQIPGIRHGVRHVHVC